MSLGVDALGLGAGRVQELFPQTRYSRLSPHTVVVLSCSCDTALSLIRQSCCCFLPQSRLPCRTLTEGARVAFQHAHFLALAVIPPLLSFSAHSTQTFHFLTRLLNDLEIIDHLMILIIMQNGLVWMYTVRRGHVSELPSVCACDRSNSSEGLTFNLCIFVSPPLGRA